MKDALQLNWITNVAKPQSKSCGALLFSTSMTSLQTAVLNLDQSFAFFTPSPLTILTKHQAFAPSGPMLFPFKSRVLKVKFCFRASANALQETHDLRNTTKYKAQILKKCKNIPMVLAISAYKVLGGHNKRFNNQSMVHQWYAALLVCCLYCITCDWSPNSCHWKMFFNWDERTSSTSVRFKWQKSHIWEWILHCTAFQHYGYVSFKRLSLDLSFVHLRSLPPHPTIFAKHRASATSSSRSLSAKFRFVGVGFFFNSSANTLQETHDLRNTMKHKAQNTAKNAKISANKWNDKKATVNCTAVLYTLPD